MEQAFFYKSRRERRSFITAPIGRQLADAPSEIRKAIKYES
ncbi:hypothetical protein CLOLEP_02667 [[Clostridium] leptum DSM 753]|uniref:Uncharacterized protein n=1 Tax=[Clostridium] leptum DSM 753 TaxID=428125 RepID=A7VVQ5_9FIRM|nr:hypothetical protein CLOLEP_02667 [[Clostridium] leptum DSM 753]